MDEAICKVYKHEDIVVLSLYLDEFTTQQERELTKDFLELINQGNSKIIIDLLNTSYVSSVGIGALIAMLKRTKKSVCDLVVCSVNDRIKKILNATRVNELFDVVETREEAITKLKAV